MTAPSEDARTRLERTEEELSWAGLAVAGTIGTAEFAVARALAKLYVKRDRTVAPPR